VFDASTFVSKAIASSKNFQFPVTVLASDTAIYDSSESLEAAITAKQAGYLEHSINPERVHRLLDHHHPDFATVLEIATNGATIDEPEGFVRQPWPDPPREIVLRVPNNILMHANKFQKKGKAFVVEASSLRPADVKKIGFCDIHLTAKAGSDDGRFCHDLSNRLTGLALNGGNAKELAIARYGQVHHPTISSLIDHWIQYNDEQGCSFSECFIFKDDISGCFPQLRIRPTDAPKIAVEIAFGLILIMINLCFGSTASSMIWDAVGRCSDDAIRKAISSVLDRYVDDYIGYGLAPGIFAD
jgi:hypothetical protein